MKKMEDRIARRLTNYYLSGDKKAAFKLSLLYWHKAGRSEDEEVAVAACIEGFYWLKLAGHAPVVDFEEPELPTLKETLRQGLVYCLRELKIIR